MFAEPFITNNIVFVSGVLSAVDFNDEPMLATDKISNVRTYRLLANEFEPIQFARAKAPPKPGFRDCGIFSKPPR